MADPRRVEFGDFLRSRREKLSPKTVGLPAGRRRRTAGLRREEVAQLAGIGVDWYIRLEQGRTVSPSVTTIDALARALRLSKTEHAHLKALARDGARAAFVPEIVPSPIRRMIHSLQHPAYITGRRWDVLAWNEAAEDIFGSLASSIRFTLALAKPQEVQSVSASRPVRDTFSPFLSRAKKKLRRSLLFRIKERPLFIQRWIWCSTSI